MRQYFVYVMLPLEINKFRIYFWRYMQIVCMYCRGSASDIAGCSESKETSLWSADRRWRRGSCVGL